MEPAPRSSLLRNPWIWAFLLGCATLTALRPLLRYEPAPPPVLWALPAYALTDAQGRPFGSAELAGKVYVVDFFFTRCASICPRLTEAMARLQERYEREGVEGVRLVSISVDPEGDTPERLADYARQHGVHPERWTLLTGAPDAVHALVAGGFKTALGDAAPLGDGLIDIAHSGKLFLVDGAGRVRGLYDHDALGLDEVFHRSRHVLREPRGRLLQ
ncbi:MAG TPA: SCO family protein [Candidatus Polarisedimenticolaceae bacterium]|nr:SCO family protein [Candidatus Polarisedimenticolaceae bacterium]